MSPGGFPACRDTSGPGPTVPRSHAPPAVPTPLRPGGSRSPVAAGSGLGLRPGSGGSGFWMTEQVHDATFPRSNVSSPDDYIVRRLVRRLLQRLVRRFHGPPVLQTRCPDGSGPSHRSRSCGARGLSDPRVIIEHEFGETAIGRRIRVDLPGNRPALVITGGSAMRQGPEFGEDPSGANAFGRLVLFWQGSANARTRSGP